MIHFDLPKQKSSIIKVLGVGGGGGNAVNHMYTQSIEGVDFVICNTDAKAIEQSLVPNKVQLGPHLTQGLGAGANPEVGKKATEESLQEIKSILELNTKMAFVTAGMGGGTGTGGAPIVAQVCKEMGILTVGIVTTPFAFEGPKRLLQAQEGIRQLTPYVDTLLVISNEKLRQQYGNLKMKEAWAKADNVLATAAKCITDIINSRGHIIVDFADVCTVMKNGGVAILGKAEAEGENRAQVAIEEALNSPLLNDSDIKGAKWVLININTAEGEHEFTMDEIDMITNYLRMQAGEGTDLIVGQGYDDTLGSKISITLIATGFDAKDPFAEPVVQKKAEPAPEKIVMTLGVEGEEQKMTQSVAPIAVKAVVEEPVKTVAPELNFSNAEMESYLMPTIVEEVAPVEAPKAEPEVYHYDQPLVFELQTEEEYVVDTHVEETQEVEEVKEVEQPQVVDRLEKAFLSRPSNIYADDTIASSFQATVKEEETKTEEKENLLNITMQERNAEVKIQEINLFNTVAAVKHEDEIEHAPKVVPVPFKVEEQELFQVTERAIDEPVYHAPVNLSNEIMDETEEQRKRAAERLQKLRSLSFNMNAADPNNEFETVPAYIRRNMELFGNTLTSVENFYSKYTVGKDENDNTNISSINTFLDGKKPD